MGAFFPGLADIGVVYRPTPSRPPIVPDVTRSRRSIENKISTRVRLFFLSMDTKPDVPMLKQRLYSSFSSFGDDMLRVSGIGEFASELAALRQPDQLRGAAAGDREQGWPFSSTVCRRPRTSSRSAPSKR